MTAMRILSGERRVKSKKPRVNGIAIATEMMLRIKSKRIVRRRLRGYEIEKIRRKSIAKVTMAEVVISSGRV